jgi:hypothetical protein
MVDPVTGPLRQRGREAVLTDYLSWRRQHPVLSERLQRLVERTKRAAQEAAL